ncbi:hypothetical protein HMPREF1092_00357 [Clostridium thermobutyricum]|uniref:Glycosyl transferase family 1 domain-containing protein n=1 Tax=Clostridium thermobutyricum TaxID=29372 RepID=N9WJA0_9CLOT|nr:glycosyltransferase [Clostridium thermobutyricum]ENZ03171.1 hypothetical protein HMPREF1092_00357 [Clostridium thermobutyricum]
MKKIGYIVSVFPSTSATFVLNEIIMLKKNNFNIKVISLKRPNNEVIQSGVEDFLDNIIYVPNVKDGLKEIIKLIIYNLKYLIKNPIKYFKNLNVALKTKSKNVIYDFYRAVYLSQHLNIDDIDHIHSQFAHSPTNIAYFLNVLTNKKYSFTCHAVDIFVEKNRVLIEKQLENASFAITISRYNIEYIKNIIFNKKLVNKFEIVRCGIDYNNLKKIEDGNIKSKNNVKIFSVGRFVEKKGFDFLIESLKNIDRKKIDFECIIVGDGPLYNGINEKIINYGLEDKIILLGAVNSKVVKENLVNSDIFILPCVIAENGDMDGIPVSLMEAMSYEVPTISTKVSGIPELITSHKNGILVEPKDIKGLEEAIEFLIKNPEKRIEYGKNARKKIIDEFGLEENTNKLVQKFKQLIK